MSASRSLPRWLREPIETEPRVLYKDPQGEICQGHDQRLNPGYDRKTSQRRNEMRQKMATHPLKYKYIGKSEDLTKGILWLLEEYKDVDLILFNDEGMLEVFLDQADEDAFRDRARRRAEAARKQKGKEVTRSDPTMEDESVTIVESGVQKIKVGISLKLCTLRNQRIAVGKLEQIQLSTIHRAITIDVFGALGQGADLSVLRQLFVSEDISLHAFRAASVSSHIRVSRPELEMHVHDLSTLFSRREKRDLYHISYEALQGDSLQNKLDPYIRAEKNEVQPKTENAGSIREAYLCSNLAHKYPDSDRASTIGRSVDAVKQVYDLVRVQELQLLETIATKEGEQLEFYSPKTEVISEDDPTCGKYFAAYLNVRCKRLQNMPRPSMTQVVKVHLEYQYYTQEDGPERSLGPKAKGVYSHMLGLVIQNHKHHCRIIFPTDLRCEEGYNVAPVDIMSKTKLGTVPYEGDVRLLWPPDQRTNSRLHIAKITIHGLPEPSAEASKAWAYCLDLLRDQNGPPACLDRSNVACFFRGPCGDTAAFKRREEMALKSSLLSTKRKTLADDIRTRVYPAQNEALGSLFDPQVRAVAVEGMGGTGKTFILANFSKRWSDRGSQMLEEERKAFYTEKLQAYDDQVYRESNEEIFTAEEDGPPVKRRRIDTESSHSVDWVDQVHALRPLSIILTQTNEAARNVAMALKESSGSFRIITSQAFEGWYEGYYDAVLQNAVAAERFSGLIATAKALKYCSILVATVGGFAGVADKVCRVGQPEVLLVDEASQLHAPSFYACLQNFHDLSKVALFGDLKQLQPYKSDVLGDVRSALQALVDYRALQHLSKSQVNFVRLTWSFRLPRILTDFISYEMYDGLLLHKDGSLPQRTRFGSHRSYLRWIRCDEEATAVKGKGKSNTPEAWNAANVACMCEANGASYSILTYYSRQRPVIEDQICYLFEKRGLRDRIPAALEKVFTIDSFQGREDDVIIISTVADSFMVSKMEDDDNFLQNEYRQNVLLTRCRKQMIIISNNTFLSQMHHAKPTLLTKLWMQTPMEAERDYDRPLSAWIKSAVDPVPGADRGDQIASNSQRTVVAGPSGRMLADGEREEGEM